MPISVPGERITWKRNPSWLYIFVKYGPIDLDSRYPQSRKLLKRPVSISGGQKLFTLGTTQQELDGRVRSLSVSAKRTATGLTINIGPQLITGFDQRRPRPGKTLLHGSSSNLQSESQINQSKIFTPLQQSPATSTPFP